MSKRPYLDTQSNFIFQKPRYLRGVDFAIKIIVSRVTIKWVATVLIDAFPPKQAGTSDDICTQKLPTKSGEYLVRSTA